MANGMTSIGLMITQIVQMMKHLCAIESIAYDFSDCTGGFSREMTKAEEWELDDAMSASASKYSPLFYPYNMEIL